MGTMLDELESKALQLPPDDRETLIRFLIRSLEDESAESLETIAQAWDAEIARRVADMDAGHTHWTASDEFMRKLRAKIASAKAHAGQS